MGDDSSWKVQFLDLSRVQNGELRREERFGYLKLAARVDVTAKEFIRLRSFQRHREVEFVVEQTYNLDDGTRTDLDRGA